MAARETMVLANRGLAFTLYELHLEGASIEKLAAIYALPIAWIEERIEAVRLCLEWERRLGLGRNTPAAAA
jgi:hypothetical protein